MGVLSVFLRHN